MAYRIRVVIERILPGGITPDDPVEIIEGGQFNGEYDDEARPMVGRMLQQVVYDLGAGGDDA